MKRWLATSRIVAVVAGVWACSASAQEPKPFVSVEAIEQISVYDLWNSFYDKELTPKSYFAVGVWPYDYESHPYDEAKGHAVAMILFGMGDVGETPVGIRVWSQEIAVVNSVLPERITSSEPTEMYTVQIKQRVCGDEPCKAQDISFRAIQRPQQIDIFAEGKFVGSVR